MQSEFFLYCFATAACVLAVQNAGRILRCACRAAVGLGLWLLGATLSVPMAHRLAVLYARWYPEHFCDGALYRDDTQGPPAVFWLLERVDPASVWRCEGVAMYQIPGCPPLPAGFPVTRLPEGVNPDDVTTSFVILAGASNASRGRITAMAVQRARIGPLLAEAAFQEEALFEL